MARDLVLAMWEKAPREVKDSGEETAPPLGIDGILGGFFCLSS